MDKLKDHIFHGTFHGLGVKLLHWVSLGGIFSVPSCSALFFHARLAWQQEWEQCNKMPRPSTRTKRMKRQDLRLPGGLFETHYREEKPCVPRCGRCGRNLSGIPRLIPSELRKLSATQRTIDRMYGGQLCHGCLRDLLKQTVRGAYTP